MGHAVQGIVEIPLAAAAAADSEGFALRPELGPECEAAQERRKAAYNHIFGVLRMLATGSGNPGAQAAIAAGMLGSALPLSAQRSTSPSDCAFSQAHTALLHCCPRWCRCQGG